MERTCDGCGNAYEAATARSQFCRTPECDRARARARKAKQRGTVVQLPTREPADDGSNEAITRAELAAAGRLDTIAGRNALSLARRLDAGAQDSGSSFAALAKQHLAAVEKALEGAAAVEDPIELRRQAAQQRRLSVVR